MVSSIAVDDAAVPHPSQRMRWVVFLCAGQRYGFPLERVSEIVAARQYTRLPGAGPEVCGLIGVRGRAVTVLDLGAVLAQRPAARRAEHRLLLLDLAERRLGLAVDDIVAIQPAQLQAAAPGTGSNAAVLGTAMIEGEAFVALDPVRLTEDLLHPV